MTEQIIRVQAYSLAEALQRAQDGITMGYTIDLESNEGYPQQFGSMITFTLIKTKDEPFPGLTEVSAEGVIEVDVAVVPEGKAKVQTRGKQK